MIGRLGLQILVSDVDLFFVRLSFFRQETRKQAFASILYSLSQFERDAFAGA